VTAQLSALINPLNSEDQRFLNNPYPMMERLRKEAPVYWSVKDKYWIISRYAEASIILRDPAFEKQIHTWKHAPNPILISLIPFIKSGFRTSKNWLLNLNPPAHTRVRSLLNKAFTGPIVQGLRPVIQSFANQLLDGFEGRDEIDLVTEYALPLPMYVIGHMLGIPVTEVSALKKWSAQLASVAGRSRNLKVLTAAGKAIEELEKYLRPSIEERRKSPRNDLLSILVQAEEEGTRLKVDELIANCILLLVAGHETTTNLIASAVICLLRYPDQLALLKAEPEKMHTMVAEVLRYEGPAQVVPRIARRDIELAGQKISSGDMCWVLLGSANRDPAEFERADVFDISRKGARNLAFGEGIHRCVGASLAEIELQIAIDMLFARYPNARLADEVINYKTPFALRGPAEVMLKLR
jgi:pimeloyl-[acyl-carrier protein] synthase